MSEIHYVERVPRRPDFCGCPPCPLCYEPVLTDDQEAPSFQETMKQIYEDRPAPQTQQEYEWAHAALYQMRQELDERDGTYFYEQDRVRMTAMQVNDLLKRAKKAAEAPKPLNTVNLDDMPIEAVEAAAQPAKTPAQIFQEAQAAYQQQQMQQYALSQLGQGIQEIYKQQVILPITYADYGSYKEPETVAAGPTSARATNARKGP